MRISIAFIRRRVNQCPSAKCGHRRRTRMCLQSQHHGGLKKHAHPTSSRRVGTSFVPTRILEIGHHALSNECAATKQQGSTNRSCQHGLADAFMQVGQARRHIPVPA